jgi:hypothetical protein
VFLRFLFSVLGSWSLDWEYEYSSIQGPPTVQQEGDRWYIIIQPKVIVIINNGQVQQYPGTTHCTVYSKREITGA